MNDYKAKIEAILTGTVAFAIAAVRPDLHNPEVKPIYKDEATASLLQLLNEARMEELEWVWDSLPSPNYPKWTHRVDRQFEDDLYARLAELKGGIGQK